MTASSINFALQLLTSVFVILALIGALIYVDVFLALSSFLIFTIGYSIISINTKDLLKKNSDIVAEKSRQIKLLQESLGSVRDIILENNRSVYLNISEIMTDQ